MSLVMSNFVLTGNTQMIEVVQTAPGKFVTASGHAIKAAGTPGGVKTIIRTSSGTQVYVIIRIFLTCMRQIGAFCVTTHYTNNVGPTYNNRWIVAVY